MRRDPSTAALIRAMLKRRGEMRFHDVQANLGMSKYATGMALGRLVRAHEAERPSYGVYRPAPIDMAGR